MSFIQGHWHGPVDTALMEKNDIHEARVNAGRSGCADALYMTDILRASLRKALSLASSILARDVRIHAELLENR